jgi:hypothetical protein
VSKELRDKGVRGPIVGNWRYIGQGASGNAVTRNNEPEGDDPF